MSRKGPSGLLGEQADVVSAPQQVSEQPLSLGELPHHREVLHHPEAADHDGALIARGRPGRYPARAPRLRLHASAGGVTIVVTMTMMTTAE